jgi:hypothetical protein
LCIVVVVSLHVENGFERLVSHHSNRLVDRLVNRLVDCFVSRPAMVAVNAAAILAYEEVDWSIAIIVQLQRLYVEFPISVCMLWTVGQSPWLRSLQGPI